MKRRVQSAKNTCQLTFPPQWISAIDFDNVLSTANIEPHDSQTKEIIFKFQSDTKILIDAAVQMLSLANQLIKKRKKVRMIFDGETNDGMGYLNRMGFFEELNKKVKVDPNRPSVPLSKIYRGSNERILEINPINPTKKNKRLPSLLASRLANAETGVIDKKQLQDSAFTVFGELIDNVFQHSSTKINGYAAFQVYTKNNTAKVVVSDSGRGILETLKPALKRKRNQKYRGFSDTQLIVEMFKKGISRKGKNRGCGLKACADEAIKYKADLRVRLNRCAVFLKPSGTKYVSNRNTTYGFNGLPLLKGTHISFSFHLA